MSSSQALSNQPSLLNNQPLPPRQSVRVPVVTNQAGCCRKTAKCATSTITKIGASLAIILTGVTTVKIASNIHKAIMNDDPQTRTDATYQAVGLTTLGAVALIGYLTYKRCCAKQPVVQLLNPSPKQSPRRQLPEQTLAQPQVEQAAQPQVEQAAQPQVEQAAQPQVEQAAQPQVEQAAQPQVEQAAQPQVEQAAQPQVEQAAQPQVEQAAQPQVEQAAPAQEQAAMTILKNTLDQVQQWNLFVDNRDNGIHYLWVQLNDKIYSVDSNNCYAVYDETTQQWSDMGITATENSSAAQRVSQLLRTPPKDA